MVQLGHCSARRQINLGTEFCTFTRSTSVVLIVIRASSRVTAVRSLADSPQQVQRSSGSGHRLQPRVYFRGCRTSCSPTKLSSRTDEAELASFGSMYGNAVLECHQRRSSTICGCAIFATTARQADRIPSAPASTSSPAAAFSLQVGASTIQGVHDCHRHAPFHRQVLRLSRQVQHRQLRSLPCAILSVLELIPACNVPASCAHIAAPTPGGAVQ